MVSAEIEIRPAVLPTDEAALRDVDTSFVTDTVFDVRTNGQGFELTEIHIEPPVSKRFRLDDLSGDHAWEQAWLALADGKPVGFVATQNDLWNHRVVIWHLYVSSRWRRQGVARALLDVALASAKERGASFAWLETSNLNVPGIRAYERLGFTLCGLDLSLYDETPAAGEIALFLRKRLT